MQKMEPFSWGPPKKRTFTRWNVLRDQGSERQSRIRRTASTKPSRRSCILAALWSFLVILVAPERRKGA